MEEDDNTQPTVQSSPFDAIRRVDEQGREYWNARDLARLLGYRQYTNFTGAIHKAEIACKESREAFNMRDDFNQRTEVILFKRARAKCSNPACRRETCEAHFQLISHCRLT